MDFRRKDTRLSAAARVESETLAEDMKIDGGYVEVVKDFRGRVACGRKWRLSMGDELVGVAEIEFYGSATVWKGLKSAENM